jgi:hypothetical protein
VLTASAGVYSASLLHEANDIAIAPRPNNIFVDFIFVQSLCVKHLLLLFCTTGPEAGG